MRKLAFNLKVCRFYFVATTLVVSLQCLSGQDPRKPRNDLWESSDRNRDALLEHLRPVLKAAGGAGRLYYRVECWAKEVGNDFSFPQLELEAPSKEKAGLDAVREIFRKCKEVTVAQGRDGAIGIRIGDVSGELLKTKIDLLTLKPRERYNPLQAIMAIERTTEVQAKMRQLGVEEPLTFFQEHLQDPAPGLPHLPASMKNVTMDEALDRVAQTFGGLVIYGECTSANAPRLFSVRFVGITDFQTLLQRNRQKK